MTTNITLELSAEVAESLTKLAEEAQLSVNELVEAVLVGYVAGQPEPEEIDLALILTPEEIVELNASIVEADKPDNKWYTDEEAEVELARIIAERRTARKQAKTGAA